MAILQEFVMVPGTKFGKKKLGQNKVFRPDRFFFLNFFISLDLRTGTKSERVVLFGYSTINKGEF
jgi:hypothetical protein